MSRRGLSLVSNAAFRKSPERTARSAIHGLEPIRDGDALGFVVGVVRVIDAENSRRCQNKV
jgi:hypothetical protein